MSDYVRLCQIMSDYVRLGQIMTDHDQLSDPDGSLFSQWFTTRKSKLVCDKLFSCGWKIFVLKTKFGQTAEDFWYLTVREKVYIATTVNKTEHYLPIGNSEI